MNTISVQEMVARIAVLNAASDAYYWVLIWAPTRYYNYVLVDASLSSRDSMLGCASVGRLMCGIMDWFFLDYKRKKISLSTILKEI